MEVILALFGLLLGLAELLILPLVGLVTVVSLIIVGLRALGVVN